MTKKLPSKWHLLALISRNVGKKGHLRKGIIMLKCWRIIILLISPSLRTVTKILEYSGTALIQFTHSAEIKREIPFSPSVLHA